MKQTLVLLAILSLAGIISWQTKSNDRVTLAEIIHQDPARKQEFMELLKAAKEADAVRRASDLDPEDELNDEELDEFRHAGGADDPKDKIMPTLRVATADILAIIGTHTEPGDSLVFYKGKYRKDDRKRLKRYNKKFGHGEDVYTWDMLKNRKTFVVQLRPADESGMVLHYRNAAYDIMRLCPPPPTGCD